MKTATIAFGVLLTSTIVLAILFIALFSISETTGKAIAGSSKLITLPVTAVNCSEENYDISFSIKGHDKWYYINRGLQKGFNFANLKTTLVGKDVVISHVVFFGNLDSRHINRLTYQDKIIYPELK